MFHGFRSFTFFFAALALLLQLTVTAGYCVDDPQKVQVREWSNSSDKSKGLQFMGMVEPGKRMVIVLMPGENVRQLYVIQGARVHKGDILAQLSNDQLVSGLADLQQKHSTLIQNAHQTQLLKLEIDIKKKHLTEIEDEIGNEKKLAETIKGYTSSIFRQLESQRRQIAGQLSILEARYDLASQTDAHNKELEKLLENNIEEVQKRIAALTIRSPFDGWVNRVAEDPARIAPGGMLLEVRDESFFLVRGTIIQHQFELIQAGDVVSVSVDFIPGREVSGVVQSISQSWQKQPVQGYASFEVLIKVEDTQSLLQPGMVVSIQKKQDNLTGK